MKSIEKPIYFPSFISPKITKSSKLKPIIGTWRNIIYLMETFMENTSSTHSHHTHSHISTRMEKILFFVLCHTSSQSSIEKKLFVYLNQLKCQLCLSSHFFIMVWSEKNIFLLLLIWSTIDDDGYKLFTIIFTIYNAKYEKKSFPEPKALNGIISNSFLINTVSRTHIFNKYNVICMDSSVKNSFSFLLHPHSHSSSLSSMLVEFLFSFLRYRINEIWNFYSPIYHHIILPLLLTIATLPRACR